MDKIKVIAEAVNKRDVGKLKEVLEYVFSPPSGFDPRDLIINLTLVSDALRRIGIDSRTFIEQTSLGQPKYIREEVQKFFSRLPENRTLMSMGYEVIEYQDKTIQYIELL